MKGLERIKNAVRGDPVDQVPVWPFCMTFSAKYAGVPYRLFATDYKKHVEAQIRVADVFGFDGVTIDSDSYREASACGGEVVFPENDLPVMKTPAVQKAGEFDFKMPDIYSAPRIVDKIEGVRLCKEHYGDEKAVCGWIESPFQSAGTFYDLNSFMLDVAIEPDFISELMDFTLELGVKFARAQIEAGADIMGIGDAMASLISADMYKELVLPRTIKMVEGLKGRGALLKYHICGDATHILPFALDAGFDIVNIDHKVDLAGAIEVAADRICIKGNVDPVTVLLSGSVEDVRNSCREILAIAPRKFILSPGCEVPRDTPHENLHEMVRSCLP